MNESEALRRLAEGNPWWRRQDWEVGDRDLARAEAAPFHYSPSVLADLQEGSVYILRGLRRTGKSVALKRALSSLLRDGVSPRRVIYFTCDDLGMSDLSTLMRVGRHVSTAGVVESRYWFIDEVTSLTGRWSRVLKRLRDQTDFDRDTVVLTGSSMTGLQDAREDLADRRGAGANLDRVLFPMGFRAFWRALGNPEVPFQQTVAVSQFRSEATRQLLQEFVPAYLDSFILAWEAYLLIGGLPNAVAQFRDASTVETSFYHAMFDIIHSDLRQGARMIDDARTQALLFQLTSALANPVNLTRMADKVGLARNTIDARIGDLCVSYVLWPCRVLGRGRPTYEVPDDDAVRNANDEESPGDAIHRRPKYYFTDPLLARIAAQRSDRQPAPDSSILTEQQLGIALLRQAEERDPGTYGDFTHVMSARLSRSEVDFAGPWMGDVAFESKYVDHGWKSSAPTLRAYTKSGVMLTRGAFDLESDVWAVPAPIAAWLLESDR